MTVEAGSGGAGTPPNGSVAEAGSAGGAGAGTGDWTAGLSQDNRSLIETKRYRNVNALADAYRSAEAKLGQAVVPPGEGAPEDELNAFYGKLGRPDTPDGYQFGLPDGLPESFHYSEDLANAYRSWAHEAGLTPHQAQAVHDRFIAAEAARVSADREAVDRRISETDEALVREFGPRDSEDFTRATDLARRAIRALGMEEALADVGVLVDGNTAASAPIIIAMSKVGERLYAEDGLADGSASARNPWSKDGFNLTEQSRIAKEDPQRAARLKAAATPL